MLLSIKAVNFSDFKLHNDYFCMPHELDTLLPWWSRVGWVLAGLAMWLCSCAFFPHRKKLSRSCGVSLSGDNQNPARFVPRYLLCLTLDQIVSRGAFLSQAFFDSMITSVCLQMHIIQKKIRSYYHSLTLIFSNVSLAYMNYRV